MKNLLIIVLLINGLCTSALAQEKLLTPENVGDVHVAIIDNAVNGCWTNLRESREYAEEQLKMRGYTISKVRLFEHPDAGSAMQKYLPLVQKLPEEFSEEDRDNLLLDILQGNRFSLVVEVLSKRGDGGLCFGTVRVALERLSLGFSNSLPMRTVAAKYHDVGINYQNFNIEVLDALKAFISDFDQYR